MADGCNLYFTEKDLKQVEQSLKVGVQPDVSNLKGILIHKVTEMLQKNESIPRDYIRKFPSAFRKVIEHTPNALGVFKPPPAYYGRGGGPQSEINGIKHKTQGDAWVYQTALGPAALITKGYKAGNSSFVLKIEATDRKDNLIKLREPYFPDENKPSFKFGKGEADTWIGRGAEAIGIDFKHSRRGYYDKIDQETLGGIKAAIQNGYIAKFCFVTNGKFSGTFKEKINVINQKLLEDELSLEKETWTEKEKIEHWTKEEEKREVKPQILYFENVMYDE